MPSLLLVLLTIGIAILVNLWIDYNSRQISKEGVASVLSGLHKIEDKIVMHDRTLRVAVGFGGTVDAHVDGVSFFNSLNVSASDGSVVAERITNLRHLEQTFSYFFSRGLETEQFLHNHTEFRQILKFLHGHEKTEWVPGSSPVQMGRQFSLLGCNVLLGVRVSEILQSLLPRNIIFVNDRLNQEETRVVLKFSDGDRWGNLKCPRSKRFIFHGNEFTVPFDVLERFDKQLTDFESHLFVLGGLHAMGKIPFNKDALTLRFSHLKNTLTKLPSQTRIHLQIGSIENDNCSLHVVSKVLPYVDSIGLNEEELFNLKDQLTTGTADQTSQPYGVADMAALLDQARDIFHLVDKIPSSGNRRRLSRLHLHTVTHEVIIVRQDSNRILWGNSDLAAAKSSLTATRYLCGNNEVSDVDFAIISHFFRVSQHSSFKVEFTVNDPVSCWTEDTFQFCVAPVVMCKQFIRSTDLNDVISASGLIVQI